MKISIHLVLNVLIPIIIGSIVIILITLIPINLSQNTWKTDTLSYISTSAAQSSLKSMQYTSQFITTFFNHTSNDILTIEAYIQKSLTGQLNVTRPYDTYYGVSTIDPRIPPLDIDNYSLFSVTFQKDITDLSQLENLHSYEVNGSSIYDNVFRAVYKSSSTYIGLYFGFESDGFYRYYPYMSLNDYQTITYECYTTNAETTGYDPRCQIWYAVAAVDDEIHYTAPNSNAMITTSKRVTNQSDLIGVIGIDFSMHTIDTIISTNIPYGSGYTFLIDSTGLLISYPGFNHNCTETVYTIESSISPSFWQSLLISYTTNVSTSQVSKNNEPWIILSVYLPSQDYYLVMLYPVSDLEDQTNSITDQIKLHIQTGTIIMCVLALLIMCLSILVILLLSKKYIRSIIELSKDIEGINNMDVQIELGNRTPVSIEFSNVNKNFGNLIVAVNFGNDAYQTGDLSKAMDLYKKVEELMKTMKTQRGLSICYNNEANVYKQMGNFIEAERLYLESIRIIEELLAKESDQDKKMGWKIMISYRKMNLGVLCKDMGDPGRLLQTYLEESLAILSRNLQSYIHD